MMYFTEDHEWVRVADGVGTVGVTDYAQEQLGDVVYVEVPTAGTSLKKGDESAVVESVKAASELYAPVSGSVTESNDTLADDPALVNSAPMEGGWFYRVKLSDPSELEGLMDEAAYKTFLEGLA